MKIRSYFVILFVVMFGGIISINASSLAYNDIPNNSYIIGTHLFTSKTSLTTKHIMLGAKTINGSSINDMVLLYKNPRGALTDGLNGSSVSNVSTYTINYRDSVNTISGVTNDGYASVDYLEKQIPNNSYVIGSHLFTSKTSLTTKHIMLAAKTINGGSINDMQIYYKNPRGKWVNGLSGEAVTPQSTYAIKYIDLVGTAKRDGYVSLSETSKEVPYGTESVTFNVVSSHGGALVVNDDNSASQVTTSGNVVTLSNISHLDAGTVIKVSVRVRENNSYTEAVATYTLRIVRRELEIPEVVIDNSYQNNGIIRWNDVDGATSYQLSFDNINYHESTSGAERVDISTLGEKVVYVKAIPDRNHINSNGGYGSATTNVYYLRLSGDSHITSVSGDGNYVQGTKVPLVSVAVENEGYKTNGWRSSEGSVAVGDEVVLNANTSLQAQSDYTTLNVLYNANGGVWNNPLSGSSVYTVNEEGTVIKKEGGMYVTTVKYNKSLARDGLTDYNGNWINFVKDGYVGLDRREYFIENGSEKTIIDQNAVYSAQELAGYAGCDLSNHDCDILVKVNWVPSYSLYIKYNSNGASLATPGNYEIDGFGFITKNNDANITVLRTGESLPRGGLIDYNASGFNLVKEGAEVPSGKEYYILNGSEKIELNQKTVYKATELASFANCNLEERDCTISLVANFQAVYPVVLEYNGNGGIWNSELASEMYGVDDKGMVIVASTGEIYRQNVNSFFDKTNSLIPCNGDTFNWSAVSGKELRSGGEYYIVNKNNHSKTTFNQSKKYSAQELAEAEGCDGSEDVCVVTLYAHWIYSNV